MANQFLGYRNKRPMFDTLGSKFIDDFPKEYFCAPLCRSCDVLALRVRKFNKPQAVTAIAEIKKAVGFFRFDNFLPSLPTVNGMCMIVGGCHQMLVKKICFGVGSSIHRRD
jgi:hypothetical protein